MRAPNVLLIVHNLDAMGGMERQAEKLAFALAERGSRVHVLTTSRDASRWLTYERRGPLRILRVAYVSSWGYEAFLRLVELVGAYLLLSAGARIDVIYGVHYTSGRHAALLARVLRRPTVVKFSGAGPPGDMSSLRKEPRREEYRRLIESIDRYACVSTTIRDEALASGLEPARLVMIPNGVDVAQFADATPVAVPGVPADAPLLLFVGRFSQEKRPDLALRAFLGIATRVPAAHLAFVGTGPLESAMHDLARSSAAADRIHFLGRRSDVPSLLRRASVFMLCSDSEGLPNVLMEALAAGVPCVATRVAGTIDVVNHERDALLVPAGDADALGEALVRVLEDPALARRLVSAGRERVRDFDLGTVADRYFALFQSLRLTGRGGHVALVPFLAIHVRLVSSIVRAHAIDVRGWVTALVVGLKRVLGIERTLLGSAPPRS